MTKRGRLSDIEKQTIFLLTQQGYNTEEIAATISRTETVVKKYLDSTNIVDDPEETTQEQPDTIRMPTAKDFMINTTMGKQAKAVSIMTKEASEKGDEHRLKAYKPSRLSKDAIHRIHQDGKTQD